MDTGLNMYLEIKTMELSFCGEVAHNVVNKEAKEYIINELKQNFNIGIEDKRAYILNNKSIYFLEKTQHIISIKSSGTNYYLYFTKINNTNYCFYIDRKIKQGYTYPRIISTKYRFSDPIFDGTLLDGELVKNENNNWMFLITDILTLSGNKLESNIIGRFNKLYKMLANDYVIDKDIDICPLIVKKLFKYNDYDYLITQFIPSLTYKTKGLYFNTLNTKHANQLFLFGNNSSNNNKSDKKPYNKKNNVNNSNTTNNTSRETEKKYVFKLERTDTPDVYNLFYKENGIVVKQGHACVSTLRTSKIIRTMMNGINSCYCQCKYNTKFNKWEPIEKSDIDCDTFLSTKESIEENL